MRNQTNGRVTINDVARMAGVSKVTVSYVLNNRQTAVRISDETRRRVWDAVKELGYHPNGLARALARKQSDVIIIVLQFPAVFNGWSGFINELMHGATDKAVELGYDLMIHTKFQPSLSDQVNALTDGRVDGAILLRDYDDPLSSMLAERNFPHVVVFSRSLNQQAFVIDCDNVLGGRLATEHLIALGHTRIGHLHGTVNCSAAVDRRKGYELAMQEAGLKPCRQDLIQVTHGGDDFTRVYELLASDDRPTALFVWSDEVAIQAIKIAQVLGLRVPEDLAVVGFDSTAVAEFTRPRLTSVRQPVYEMAARAVECLVAQLRGETEIELQQIHSPKLDVRESCGAVPAGSAVVSLPSKLTANLRADSPL